METTQSKLVGRLTTETKQRVSNYKANADRHVALSELNRLTKLRRNQRIVKDLKEFGLDFVKYIVPYVVVIGGMYFLLTLGG